jgi:lysophospholipase L1-like esterase
MVWHSFVAMGDSFTEGLDDPYPEGDGYRGWADLVAARLAAEVAAGGVVAGGVAAGGQFRYANLAIRGRLFGRVVDEQVPAALAMRPDLVSFAAGGNDVLRRSFEFEPLAARFDKTVATLRAAGADVILFRSTDVSSRLPAQRMIGPRVRMVNQLVAETAHRHGAYLVDLWDDVAFAHPAAFSEDRLHLSAAGHRRVAAHVLTVLGLAPDPDWLAVPAPAARRSWPAARAADVRWARQYLAPWVRRRLTGRSSGDLRVPKRPELSPLTE